MEAVSDMVNGNKAFNEMLIRVQQQHAEGQLSQEAFFEFLILGITEINNRLSSIEANQKTREDVIENEIEKINDTMEARLKFRIKYPPTSWLLRYHLKSTIAYVFGAFIILLGFTMQPTRSVVIKALFGIPDIPGDWAFFIFPLGILLIIMGRIINVGEKKIPEDDD